MYVLGIYVLFTTDQRHDVYLSFSNLEYVDDCSCSSKMQSHMVDFINENDCCFSMFDIIIIYIKLTSHFHKLPLFSDVSNYDILTT